MVDKRVIDAAARAAAGTVAGAAGMAFGVAVGPAGALIAPVVEQVLSEVLGQLTSPRQRDRVQILAESAASAYRDLQAHGFRLRTDDFFGERDGRWSAGEVAEAAFLAAANEPSTLKVPYMGRLLALVAVDASVDAPTAHWAIVEAEHLTWIQYLHLAIVGRMDELEVPAIEVGKARSRSAATVSSHQQMFDLTKWSRRLLDATPVIGFAYGEQPRELRIAHHWLAPSGELLYRLLGLEYIPRECLVSELKVLAEDDGTDPDARAEAARVAEVRRKAAQEAG